jgi:hypothetical protein
VKNLEKSCRGQVGKFGISKSDARISGRKELRKAQLFEWFLGRNYSVNLRILGANIIGRARRALFPPLFVPFSFLIRYSAMDHYSCSFRSRTTILPEAIQS